MAENILNLRKRDMMNDNEDPTYHPRNRRGRKKREYDSLSTSIKEDLLPGYRILQDIIGISKFFLDEPEPRQRGMLDYYHVITKPISFNEIRRKFFEAEYNAIPEFISDVRLLLLNCYRYFGPDDVHTKRALRIEEILEKRIASLPGYLREQCSLEAANLVNKDSEQQSEKLEESNDLEKTATEDPGENQKKKEQGDLVQCQENQTEDEGQTKEVKDNFEDTEKKDIENEEEKEDKEKEETGDEKNKKIETEFVSKLLKSVEGEKTQRGIERRKMLLEERRSEKEKDFIDWERGVLCGEKNLELMKYMWELPVIGHFVALSLDQLNINPIPMYEMERMFLMPQASESLASLMTTLLSAPLPRMKLHVKPPMPYKIWTKMLVDKVAGWYKLYHKKQRNPQIVFEKYGIEHQFWKVLGDANPFEQCEFHQLSFHQRVFLVKTLCDYCLQNHKILRDTVAEKTEGFQNCYLGVDRTGARYLHFSEFLVHDVRVYKQNLDPMSWTDRVKQHENGGRGKARNKKKKRKSSWQLGKIEKKIKTKQKSPLNLTSLESEKMTAGNAEPLDLGDESVNEPTESEKNNNEKMNGSECNGTNSSTVVQEDSNEKIKPLILVRDKLQYDPTWLEPSPEDFVLVADSVEGIRELLDSFCDDDVELIHRLDRSKKDVRSRPNCEVRLTGRLRMLLSDVEPLEHVFLNNVKTYRRKLHEEWSNFVNRPPDFVDPDEAFWLNEKDSTTEVIENEVPDTPDQTKVNNDELPPAVPVPTDVSEDVPGGMTLRNRRIEDHLSEELLAQFNSTEESSQSDSDESDNWELPKSRKRKRPKTPKLVQQDNQLKTNPTEDEATPTARSAVKKRLFENDDSVRQEQNNLNGAVVNEPLQNSGSEASDSFIMIPRYNSRGERYFVKVYNRVGTANTTPEKDSVPKNAQPLLPSPKPTVSAPENVVKHLPQISVRKIVQPDEVVCISDSDSEVEFIDEVYNPKLDAKLAAQKPPRTKCVIQKMLSARNPQGPVPVSLIPASTARNFQVNSNVSLTMVPVDNQTKPSGSQIARPVNSNNQPRYASTNVQGASPVHQGQKTPALSLTPVRGQVTPRKSPASILLQSPASQTSPNILASLTLGSSMTVHANTPTTPKALLNGGTGVIRSASNNSPFPSPPTPRRRMPQMNQMSPGPMVQSVRSLASPTTSPTIRKYSPIMAGASPNAENRYRSSPVMPNIQISPSQRGRAPQTNQMSPRPSGVASPVSPHIQISPVSRGRAPRAFQMSPVSPHIQKSPMSRGRAPQANAISPRPGEIVSPVSPQIQISPTSRGRSPQSIPPSGIVQGQQNQSVARLVVVPGDGNSGSNYALMFPNGKKVILTPSQVADLRAANGGHLATNISL